MKKLIYIADDEANIRNLLKQFLDNEGYETVVFENGDLLYNEFQERKADLVILDVMMPGKNGLEICTDLRKITNIPIIILTAKDSDMDYVRGITVGSDDYITKPFRPTQLLMKIHALFRRVDMDNETKKTSTNNISFGDLTLNEKSCCINVNDKPLKLTQTEYKVLSFMMKDYEATFSKEKILDEIWGFSDIESRAADENIRRIRKKLSESGSNVTIETVWGFGFKLKV